MVRLTVKQRIEVLILRGCNDMTRTQQEVCDLFNAKYPDRPISRSTISKIERKYAESGDVRDIPKPGRPKISEDTKINVLLSVEENFNKPSRIAAGEHDISQRSVLRLLKSEKYHPYKIQLIQELNDDDPDRRIQFCERVMDLCHANPGFHRRILFSDEATFCLNGTVNRQNCRYWSRGNPHWVAEGHTQYQQKLNVWAGILDNRILGPIFFEDNLTGERYLEFLRDELMPALTDLFPNENDPDIPDDNIWYQQDGAPPHFARPVRNFLDQHFPGRWIGRRGPIEWPPRSPDLTPLDFFLWGYLKSKVYVEKLLNLEDLKNRIRLEMRRISPEVIHRVQEEFVSRLAYCQETNGWQFEHLIR